MTSKFHDMTGNALEAAVEGALKGGGFVGHALQEQVADLLTCPKNALKVVALANPGVNSANETSDDFMIVPKIKPEEIMNSFDLMQRRSREAEERSGRGPGFHEVGNDITLARLDGVQTMTRGKDQIVVTRDGKVQTSYGAETTKVTLSNMARQANVEGTQIKFGDGMHATVVDGDIVQFGYGRMSSPSPYNVVDEGKH
ncbi:MAG: hypothetical protein IAF58_10225 [Leptolyngbya sp.]|nr:hypothetical protein [Candidatus Melainabacteria bacterium]